MLLWFSWLLMRPSPEEFYLVYIISFSWAILDMRCFYLFGGPPIALIFSKSLMSSKYLLVCFFSLTYSSSSFIISSFFWPPPVLREFTMLICELLAPVEACDVSLAILCFDVFCYSLTFSSRLKLSLIGGFSGLATIFSSGIDSYCYYY